MARLAKGGAGEAGKKEMYQYRLIVNGAQGAPTNSYPGAQWEQVAQVIEDRGGHAQLLRRLVTDAEILELVEDTTGYIRLGARVACPWEVLAELISA